MGKQIAVFVGVDGETALINNTDKINVYEKINEKWIIKKQIPFCIIQSEKSISIRENFIKIVDELEACRLLVGKQVSGLVYNVFDKSGFNIWEIEGKPEEFLDYIIQKEEEISNEESQKNTVENPIKNKDNGYYYVNLKKYQESNTGITSKQILLSFLKNETFYELEIICSHIPPWFEREFQKLSLKVDVETLGLNEYRLKIHHMTCEEKERNNN
ncbi:MAG: Fe-only nitrogenase accessory protein AnfO [Bacillota bacterium]|nr:Fe-only nitrogenase accessory protein AnfO [Bacillota bacterium]